MKVLFVTPPYHCGVVEVAGRWIPLTFVYLAGAARKAGFDTHIYDAMSKFASHDDIIARIDDLKPDVVATTCITSTYPDGLEIMKAAKAAGAVTMMGGVHPSFMWQEVLGETGAPVDYVVIGEGEQTVVELLTAIRDRHDDLSQIRGIAYRDGDTPVRTPKRPRLVSLDHMPMAWDLLEWTDYTYFVYPGSRLGAVSTSRGCNHDCTFCSQQKFWEKSWRGRTPELVVNELEHLRRVHGVDVVLLSDEYPTPDREMWEHMLDLIIERDLGMRLLLETRVEDVVRDEDILPKYVEAGVAHVYVGVEATEQSTLDIINKDASVETGIRALRLLRQHDIISETSFVLGFPTETPAKIKKTLELSIEYDPDNAHYLAITPWPYADMWQEMEPYVKVHDYRKYNLIDPIIEPIEMTLGDVDNALVDCYRQFYTHKGLQLLKGGHSDHYNDYMVRAMKLIMNSSFVKQKMAQGKGMPPKVREMLKKLRLVGRGDKKSPTPADVEKAAQAAAPHAPLK